MTFDKISILAIAAVFITQATFGRGTPVRTPTDATDAIQLQTTAAWDKDASDDFNGAWSSLTGIPAGLLDGDSDTHLTEAEVDAFVANNGYVATSSTSAWDKNAADDFDGAWSSLTGIPADIADGDTDTHLTESQVDTFVANNGYALASSLIPQTTGTSAARPSVALMFGQEYFDTDLQIWLKYNGVDWTTFTGVSVNDL